MKLTGIYLILAYRSSFRMYITSGIVKKSLDVAGTPFFCLGALTLAFCGVLVVAVLGSASGDLPSPVLNVLGMSTHA